jgi:hypothetical protein
LCGLPGLGSLAELRGVLLDLFIHRDHIVHAPMIGAEDGFSQTGGLMLIGLLGD